MEYKLHEPAFRFLPMTKVKPTGWLLNQLKIQADSLSGQLDKFWPDIKDSKWIGGEAEGWERMPYWLDGFIPLAFLLDDEDMKSRAVTYMQAIMDNQCDDGWLCPTTKEERGAYDTWSFILILKVLVVYHDATEDPRVEEVVERALYSLDRHIDSHTLFGWAQTRWFEALIAICWLYERTGEGWLIKLATKLKSQGFDWQALYKNWPYEEHEVRFRWSFMSHVVNNAMAQKCGALLWRMSGEESDKAFSQTMDDMLEKYHGMVTGMFSGDECLAGKEPIQGSELCAVVEYMYSLEQVMAITGESQFGDRLERVTYNALPATFSPDMWTHQYVQQVNQVQCSTEEDRVFFTVGKDANLFGLEPNFGCCTANLSQGWPKFAASLFMRSEDTLAVAAYAPCAMHTEIDGVGVAMEVVTDYPFKDKVTVKVKTDQSVNFKLKLRIPSWCASPTAVCDGKLAVVAGGYFVFDGPWSGDSAIELTFPMEAKLVSRPNNLYAITRGPLVYTLPIGENWVQINKDMLGREYPHCDYEVYPTTNWNYGLCVDDQAVSNLIFDEKAVGDCPFSPEGAPIKVEVQGKKVEWSMENGSAKAVPEMTWVEDACETLRLIPYGCTTLRMTEMPLIKD